VVISRVRRLANESGFSNTAFYDAVTENLVISAIASIYLR